MTAPRSLNEPFHVLDTLPRALWLGSTITAVGTADARLRDVPRWLAALLAGELPPRDAHFDDPSAAHALRQVIGELALPAMACGVHAAVHQIIRTSLWHLDRLIDRPAHQPRADAVAAMAESFRAEWTVERAEWDRIAALLRGMGELSQLAWDSLQGRLNARGWTQAQALAALLAEVPEIVELLRRIGRGIAREGVAERAMPQPRDASPQPVPIVWRRTALPDAPGEMHGIRLGANLARMVPAEAAQLRHPLLHKLWRARLAESRLRVWDESAELVEAVPDPAGATRAPAADDPRPHERGPMIVCVDTSGSMRGAPEQLAKAVVLEAARTAHREQRACHLIAFGGAGEVVESTLPMTLAGLDRLFDFLGQSFDGGTDIATPIERAVARVHRTGWREADVLIVSDGEFGSTPAALARLDAARAQLGLRVEGLLIGDRETMGLLEVCDHIHWVRDWRRFDPDDSKRRQGFSPVHSQSLTALYFPNALSERASRRR